MIKKKSQWTPLLTANVGFGQGVAATPLQLVTAFAPFANGGYLVQPQILLREVDFKGGRKKREKRILSPQTVERMKDILVSVTEDKKGTGRNARIPGMLVAGKTGTAQKYEKGSGYSSGKYFSSFIGFLPAENPQVLVGVMIDEPKKQYYANQIAAPLFKRIAKQSMQIMDRIPRLVVATSKRRKTKRRRSKPRSVAMRKAATGKYVMPNLKGMTMREAIRGIGNSLTNVRTNGYGFIQSQSPEAGSMVTSKTPVLLKLSPAG